MTSPKVGKPRESREGNGRGPSRERLGAMALAYYREGLKDRGKEEDISSAIRKSISIIDHYELLHLSLKKPGRKYQTRRKEKKRGTEKGKTRKKGTVEKKTGGNNALTCTRR